MLLLNSFAAAQTQSPEEIGAGTTTSQAPPTPTTPKLPLAIHYEALCPDSMYFIRRRLYDALIDNDWWPRTELKLYPFGKASVSGLISYANNWNTLILLRLFSIVL